MSSLTFQTLHLFMSHAPHHVGRVRESHGNPSLGVALYGDVQVLFVACVSIDTHEYVALGGVTPTRVSHGETVVSRVTILEDENEK